MLVCGWLAFLPYMFVSMLDWDFLEGKTFCNSQWGLQLKLQLRGGCSGKGPLAVLLLFCPGTALLLFSPAAQLPWGQQAGCQSRCQSLPESLVHPWALALGTGKEDSVHTPGPGGSRIGTGRAGLLVWAGSWLQEEEWTQDPNMIWGSPSVSDYPLSLALAPCSLFCILWSLLSTSHRLFLFPGIISLLSA